MTEDSFDEKKINNSDIILLRFINSVYKLVDLIGYIAVESAKLFIEIGYIKEHKFDYVALLSLLKLLLIIGLIMLILPVFVPFIAIMYLLYEGLFRLIRYIKDKNKNENNEN